MQSVLVDTDVAIDFLRGRAYAGELMERLWEADRAYLSILSVYELHAGMREAEREATEDFIAACNVEAIGLEVARRGGELYRTYRGKGVTLSSNDCLIHATALVRGHKIATRNTGHYPDRKVLYKV